MIFSRVSKAIAAAASAAAGALVTAEVDGVVTVAEWVAVGVALVAAGLTTYAAPANRTPAPKAPPLDPAA